MMGRALVLAALLGLAPVAGIAGGDDGLPKGAALDEDASGNGSAETLDNGMSRDEPGGGSTGADVAASQDKQGRANAEASQRGQGGAGKRQAMPGDELDWEQLKRWQKRAAMERARARYYKAKAKRLKRKQQVEKYTSGEQAGLDTSDIHLTTVYGRPGNLTGVFYHQGRWWRRQEGETLTGSVSIEQLNSTGATLTNAQGEMASIGITAPSEVPKSRPGGGGGRGGQGGPRGAQRQLEGGGVIAAPPGAEGQGQAGPSGG